jgi:hypothetical protein
MISSFELQIVTIVNSKPQKLIDSLISIWMKQHFALQVTILMEQHFSPEILVVMDQHFAS